MYEITHMTEKKLTISILIIKIPKQCLEFSFKNSDKIALQLQKHCVFITTLKQFWEHFYITNGTLWGETVLTHRLSGNIKIQ